MHDFSIGRDEENADEQKGREYPVDDGGVKKSFHRADPSGVTRPGPRFAKNLSMTLLGVGAGSAGIAKTRGISRVRNIPGLLTKVTMRVI